MVERDETMTTRRNTASRKRGFTLIEIAIMMAVVGLLLGASAVTARHLEEKRLLQRQTERMETVRDAVVGYALRNRTRARTIVFQGAAGSVVSGNSVVVPAGRPYLPCPDVNGDGYEDRVPRMDLARMTAGQGGFRQGVEINAPDSLTMEIQIASNRPQWWGDSSDYNYGGCLTSRGTIPWRTLGVDPSDHWGNRHTYFADPAFASAVFGFDSNTVANIYDSRAPRESGMPPSLRSPETFDAGLGTILRDRQCPAVICAGGRANPGPSASDSTNACVQHITASPNNSSSCAWHSDRAENVILRAGSLTREPLPDFSSLDTFPVGGISDGLPFVILSHGPNGRGAVNHHATLRNPLNSSNIMGPICNHALFGVTAGAEGDILNAEAYPADNHEAINATRLAPGNGSIAADRRCPPLRAVLDSGDITGVELNPSVFVWEPIAGGLDGRKTFDDLLLWMTRQELVSDIGAIPRGSPFIIADVTP